jgi:hypothetical protein
MIFPLNFSKMMGQVQNLSPFRIYVAANIGTPVTIATAAVGSIEIVSVLIRSRGSTTTDFTSLDISGGTSARVELIPDSRATQAALASEGMQVVTDAEQRCVLKSGETLVANLDGTGATYVDFDVYVSYRILDAGATLS